MLKILILILFVQKINCEKSFTIVMDTTKSMQEEINLFKGNIASVVNTIRSKDFVDYILITFNDKDVETPLVSSEPKGLVDIIQFLEAIGGEECPEDSLAAIEKALEVSKPNSYIYVFTDAEARIDGRIDNIKQLCQNRRSQVIVFISGSCSSGNQNQTISENAYYEITRNCGGSVFQLNLGSLRYVFKYIKEITKVDWSDVNTHQEFMDKTQYTLKVDSYTKDLVMAVSGNYPTVYVTGTYGETASIEIIIETRTMLVIRLKPKGTGEYVTNISCVGPGHVTFYRKKVVQFRYGFSSLQPNSFRETASRPIPGIMNYILLSLPDDSTTELMSVNMQMSDTSDINKLDFYALDESRGLYLALVFIEPERFFKIFIKCKDKSSYQDLTGSTVFIQPQVTVAAPKSLQPNIEILGSTAPLIDFGTSFKTTCKVSAYPKPEIWWENDAGEKLPSESALLEIPSTYISYGKIENATTNTTITCLCKNEIGEDSQSINIYVNRTFVFDVITYPTDITVEYGNESKLFCEANAYPDAEIKWYHNDTLITESENIQFVTDENMLLISNMSIEETGEYKCVISNTVETRSFTANVNIAGLEVPQIKLENMEVVLKPGDWTELECTILKGIPVPEVTWKYKSVNGDLDGVPEGVYVEGKSLKIPSAATEHGGFYVCEAMNLLGVDSQEVSVKVQYAPKIKDKNEVKIVKIGDFVELPCDVDAVPKADVQWDMYQDDVIMTFDEHHNTDDKHTHRFVARSNDSGMYHCTAQNAMGSATRTVTLNVLVGPYIKPLPWDKLIVRSGANLTLSCDVILGSPVPSTKWQYITKDFDTRVLIRGHSAGKLDLVLRNVNRRQEGTYQCVAENEVGPDSVKVYLKVI